MCGKEGCSDTHDPTRLHGTPSKAATARVAGGAAPAAAAAAPSKKQRKSGEKQYRWINFHRNLDEDSVPLDVYLESTQIRTSRWAREVSGRDAAGGNCGSDCVYCRRGQFGFVYESEQEQEEPEPEQEQEQEQEQEREQEDAAEDHDRVPTLDVAAILSSKTFGPAGNKERQQRMKIMQRLIRILERDTAKNAGSNMPSQVTGFELSKAATYVRLPHSRGKGDPKRQAALMKYVHGTTQTVTQKSNLTLTLTLTPTLTLTLTPTLVVLTPTL